MLKHRTKHWDINPQPYRVALSFLFMLLTFVINGQTVNEAEAYKNLAQKLYGEAIKQDSTGITGEALKLLERAIFLDENFELAHRKSGEIKIKTSDYTGALSDLNRAIEIQATPDAHLLRAQANFRLGNNQAGYDDVAMAKNISPDTPFNIQNPQLLAEVASALFEQAMADLKSDNTSAAFEKLDEALLLHPEFAEAYFQKGIIFFDNADYISAQNNFEKVQNLKALPEATLFLIRTKIKNEQGQDILKTFLAIDADSLTENVKNLYDTTSGELADMKYAEALKNFTTGSGRQAGENLAVVEKLIPDFFGTYYHQGIIAISDNDPIKAIDLFEYSISLKPNKASYLQLGTIKTQTGDLDGAFQAMATAKTIDSTTETDPQTAMPSDALIVNPETVPETIAKVPSGEDTLTEEDQPNENISTTKSKKQPEPIAESNGYFDLIDKADELFNLRDYTEALKYYTQASQVDNTKYYPKTRIAQIAEILENTNDSSDELPANTNLGEDEVEAGTTAATTPEETNIDDLPGAEVSELEGTEESLKLYNEGLAFYYDSDLDGALKKFTQAINLDPKLSDAYYNSGFIKLNQGYYEEAIADFDIVLSLMPNDKAYFYKGRALVGLYRFEDAAVQFTMAIELNPDFYYAYNNRGNVFFQLGNYEAAINDFNKVIMINPDYVFAYNNRGNAYFKLDNYNAALDDYNLAINLRPDYGFAYLNRGITHEILGNMEQACNDWKKASELGIQVAEIYFQEQCIKE
jgi:tetratricopeptide (TPR) repeat protein